MSDHKWLAEIENAIELRGLAANAMRERDAFRDQLAQATKERDEWNAAGQLVVDMLDPAKPIADPVLMRLLVQAAKDANRSVRDERDEYRGLFLEAKAERDAWEENHDSAATDRDLAIRRIAELTERAEKAELDCRDWRDRAIVRGDQLVERMTDVERQAERDTAEAIAARLEQDAERLTKRSRGNGADILVAGALYSHAADIRNDAWRKEADRG